MKRLNDQSLEALQLLRSICNEYAASNNMQWAKVANAVRAMQAEGYAVTEQTYDLFTDKLNALLDAKLAESGAPKNEALFTWCNESYNDLEEVTVDPAVQLAGTQIVALFVAEYPSAATQMKFESYPLDAVRTCTSLYWGSSKIAEAITRN